MVDIIFYFVASTQNLITYVLHQVISDQNHNEEMRNVHTTSVGDAKGRKVAD